VYRNRCVLKVSRCGISLHDGHYGRYTRKAGRVVEQLLHAYSKAGSSVPPPLTKEEPGKAGVKNHSSWAVLPFSNWNVDKEVIPEEGIRKRGQDDGMGWIKVVVVILLHKKLQWMGGEV
jgi:hypothetical protein